MGEQPIFTTKAHVFQIDPATKKKWLPASAQAINVSFYYDSTRNTYRIISVEGTKAIINSTITPNMSFTKTSVKFGQWSDSRANTVYGLGFNTEADLSKFVEKFKEVKELTRQASPSPKPAVINQTNGASPTPNDSNNTTQDNYQGHSPANSPKPGAVIKSEPVDLHNSTNAASLPNNQVIDQLKYENDRLKIALAQSSTNAKKWEIELQTLKNNNARLTTALQESTSNVEEWKKQLAIYKEESTRMKRKYMDSEKSGSVGSELLQRQLTDLRDKLTELERTNSQKQEEIMALHGKLDSHNSLQSENHQLKDKVQSLERDKEDLQRETHVLREKFEGAQSSHGHQVQEMRGLQQQIGTKMNDLYGLSNKMAELLNH